MTPDLTILGKALGAGLPIGAVSGTDAAMEAISSSRLMHRGTFNGNPLSMAAGIACLQELLRNQQRIYADLERHAAGISTHINAEAARTRLKLCAQHACGALQIFAGVTMMRGMADLNSVDKDMVLRFTGLMLQHDVFTLPCGLMYISAVHTDQDIVRPKAAISAAMATMSAEICT